MEVAYHLLLVLPFSPDFYFPYDFDLMRLSIQAPPHISSSLYTCEIALLLLKNHRGYRRGSYSYHHFRFLLTRTSPSCSSLSNLWMNLRNDFHLQANSWCPPYSNLNSSCFEYLFSSSRQQRLSLSDHLFFLKKVFHSKPFCLAGRIHK